MSVSPESPVVNTVVSSATSGHPAQFGRAAMAILVTMVLLMVALTGVLVETTRRQPAGEVEVPPPDPGNFARR